MSSRRLAALVAPLTLVAAMTTTSWAAPADPVPVKDDPTVAEGAPTSHGAWLGWRQNTRRDPSHDNFLVQRGTRPPIRVNAAGTTGLSGGMAGHDVYYVQQFRDRRPRIIDFDLETGDRTPLPPEVNHSTQRGLVHGVRGDATVSGPWLLYSGFIEAASDYVYPTWTVMLYNRVSHRLRQVDGAESDADNVEAGQVNGRYVTYWSYGRYGGSDVYRYDIETKRHVRLRWSGGDRYDPAVSSDGTVYSFAVDEGAPSGGPRVTDLVRQRVGAPAQVIATLTTETAETPRETFVKDRPNGSRVVFFSWKGDVYKLVDSAPTAARY